MIRKLTFLCIALSMVMFSACRSEKEAPAADIAVPQEVPAGPKAADLNAEIIRKNNENMDKELLEEFKKRDSLPPIGSSHMEVVSTNDRISIEDAERSYLFRKPAIEHCYVIALARDESAKGQVELTIKRDMGSKEAVLDRMETDIKTEKFEDCVRNAVERWPLPEGAQISVKIRFSSRPAPSAEELQKMVREHEDHHHP